MAKTNQSNKKGKKKSSSKNNEKSKIELKPDRLIFGIVFALVAAIIISSVAISNTHRKESQTIYDFGKKIAQGIDVSEHNGELDWQMLAQKFDFAFIRVGYRGYGNGDICEDKYAKDNLKAAQKAGIPFGVYFYTQAVSEKEAKAEADFVLSMIKHYDLALPVVIDFEYPADENGIHTGRLADKNLGAKDNTKIIKAFCDRVEDKGYISGLYASSSVLKNSIHLKDINDSTIIWAADYNDKVTYDIDYTIWQYSKTGQTEGNGSKYIDLNYWYSK